MVSMISKTDERDMLIALDMRMEQLADQIFADSQDNIITKNIIDEGTLLKSGNIRRNFLNKEVRYSAPYANEIENGRTPGTMPPVSSLIGWVKRKGIAKTEIKAKSIAFAIAQDIKIRGQQPRPFLGPAVEKAKANLN